MNSKYNLNPMLYNINIYENIISLFRFSVKIKYFDYLEIYKFIHKVHYLNTKKA